MCTFTLQLDALNLAEAANEPGCCGLLVSAKKCELEVARVEVYCFWVVGGCVLGVATDAALFDKMPYVVRGSYVDSSCFKVLRQGP